MITIYYVAFAGVINNIARLYNKFVMVILTLTITALLFSVNADPNKFQFSSNIGISLLSAWLLFALISFFYTLNGFMVNGSFKKEIKKYQLAGKPLQGVRGFNDLIAALTNARNTSLLITFSALVSLGFFVLVPIISKIQNKSAGSLFATLAIAMAFVTVSIVFLVKYPERTALDPGGLTGFYEPDIFPMTLDNILSDVFMTYIDPVTWLDIDEYRKVLGKMLDSDFESDETYATRLSRAFEKILLIAYLSNSIKEVMTPNVIKRELIEMIGEEDYDDFITGKETSLSFDEIKTIMKKVEKQTPEVFRLVDRLIINLTDNYEEFTTKDLYFTVSALTNQGSISESAGLIVFFLNNTITENKTMKVSFRSDRNSVHPEFQEVRITLDPQTDPFPKKKLEFISEGEDVLSILADILQVGDAVWFRFKPSGFGFKVVTISAEDGSTGHLVGQSIEMKFTKAISWYVQAYLPKLSALAGVAIPVIKGILGF